MVDLPTLQLRHGERVLLVSPDAVQRWDGDTARALLRAALAEAPLLRGELLRLAEQLGQDSRDLDAAIDAIALAIARGTLVPVELPERPGRGLQPLIPGFALDDADWANAPRLSELRPPTEPELGWVSLELVDHTGVPLGGLTVTLVHCDGRRDRVVLDRAGRYTAREVPTPGPTRIEWPAQLEHPPGPPALALDGFTAGADDLAVARAPGAATVLPALDRHWRVVVQPPTKQPTLSFPAAMFATDSALPTHAITDLVTRAQESADADPSLRLGLFAHADTRGNPGDNKQLADRRAQAAFAVLTGDWPLFDEVMQHEPCPVDRVQAMLRVLGCNPTAIDGEPGDQTALAVAAFRRAYNRDTWHDEGRARAFGDLPEGDALDDATTRAILDAYHAELSGRLDPGRFVGPKFVGCGEFNPLATAHADNRRTTLVIYRQDAPRDGEFPCTRGDAGACQVDGGGQFTCKFYRERIQEKDVAHELTPFWDYDWLRTITGKTHLSALTHLPDSNEVTFLVRVVEGGRQPDDDDGTGEPPAHGEVVAELSGVIRAGVAYALWDHGPDYDPLDQEQWFRKPCETEADRLWLAPYLPPVFSVQGEGYWGFSSGPGVDVRRIAEDAQPSGAALAVTANGRIVLVRGDDTSAQARALRVTAMRAPGLRVLRESGGSGG